MCASSSGRSPSRVTTTKPKRRLPGVVNVQPSATTKYSSGMMTATRVSSGRSAGRMGTREIRPATIATTITMSTEAGEQARAERHTDEALVV